jgi:hypothetical protein
MDNVGSNTPNPNPNPNHSDSIPLDSGTAQPSHPETARTAAAPGVSRAPLNLGGAAAAAPAAPAVAKAPVVRPVPPRAPVAVAAHDRITECKTFFTKLHPGAIRFLEEQITAWLKDNPSIVIKRTDVVTGEITEKKSEPSLIIVVWY